MTTTLIEILRQGVGDECLGDPQYLRSLGYDEDTLASEAVLICSDEGLEIYSIGGGYHISSTTSEFYSEDPVGDGVISEEKWAEITESA